MSNKQITLGGRAVGRSFIKELNEALEHLTPSDLAQLAARHGYVLMPIEPHKDIFNAMNTYQIDDMTLDGQSRSSYKAMIEAGKVK